MNSILTVTTLLLLTSTLFHVNAARSDEEERAEIIPNAKVILKQSKNNILKQSDAFLQKFIGIENIEEKRAIIDAINTHLSPTQKQFPISEVKDMKESSVHPKDNDDESTELKKKPNMPDEIDDTMKDDEEQKILAAKIFPDNPDKSITDLPVDIQRNLTHETYEIVDNDNDEKTSPKVTASDVTIVPVTSTMETLTIPTTEGSLLTLETREEMIKKHSDIVSLESTKAIEKMSPGVIALVSAIGFAAMAVFIYFILIGWRRYQEHLRGHRELLVNDFDSNDINNLEL